MSKDYDSEIIGRGLESSATTPERLQALGELGLTKLDICQVVGITDRALRAWRSESAIPRPEARNRLDDLRHVMGILVLEQELSPASAVEWMHSRLSTPPYERPIELLTEDPEKVIAEALAITRKE